MEVVIQASGILSPCGYDLEIPVVYKKDNSLYVILAVGFEKETLDLEKDINFKVTHATRTVEVGETDAELAIHYYVVLPEGFTFTSPQEPVILTRANDIHDLHEGLIQISKTKVSNLSMFSQLPEDNGLKWDPYRKRFCSGSLLQIFKEQDQDDIAPRSKTIG